MKKIQILSILFLMQIACFAQVNSVKRIEFDLEDDISITDYIPFGEFGIIQRSMDDTKKKKDRKNWTTTYTLFNTDLEKISSLDLKVPKKYSYELRSNTKKHFFEFSYDKKGNYILHCVEVSTLKTTTLTGKLPPKMTVSSIKALDDYIYISGYSKKLPIIVVKNRNTGVENFIKVIPVSKRDFLIHSFEINTKSQEAYLFIRDKIAGSLISKMLVYSGDKKTSELTLPSYEDKYIQDATASKMSDGSYIVTGTYNNSYKGTASVGMFICKIKDQKILFTQYVNYLDIKNFTSYLSERRQEKIEKKKNKKEQKGEELELNYLIAPHNIIEYNNTYILVGEAYYPTYRRECYTTTTASGGTTQTCTYVFDGYQYSHYFVYSFDTNGKYLWSNSKEMNIEYKPYSVMQFLDIRFDNNGTLSTLYGTGKTFNYTEFDKIGTEIKSQAYNTIETLNTNDNIRNSTMNTLHWYKNTFIAFGYQKIKNSEDKEKRKVYYLNKLEVIE